MGLLLIGNALAQDKVETTINADFVNEYIWRGLKCGDVSVQPTLGVDYKGLSLTAWGSHGLSNKDDVKELDLTLAYSIGGFNIGITDYWFSEGLKRAFSSYFEASVPFRLATVDWTATAGVVPYATTTYGTTGFAVTNLTLRATKEIRVTDSFSIPIFGQLTGNPCSQKAYLVLGFTLQID